MGKHNRRKRGGGKGKGPKQASTSSDSKGNNNITVVQRLRHADSKTRQAALAAINTTVLDPESLALKKRKIKKELLQAILERVMDNDLECAHTASGCLANYVNFSEQPNHEETASWIVVLVRRLTDCEKKLEAGGETGKNSQWWALAMQCLTVLCRLVETNELALDRLNEDDPTPVLLGLFKVATKHLQETKSVASKHSDPVYIEETLKKIARMLHSMLDDNFELLKKWLESDGTGWVVLQDGCATDYLPISARLHCAGALVTARTMVQDSAMLQQAVASSAIPLLASSLMYNTEYASTLAFEYTKHQADLDKEEADDALERDVIKNVKDRNESARLIARRQKQLKDEKTKEGASDEMKVVDEVQDAVIEDEKEPAEQSDAREAMESARSAWREMINPLELALEITANMTSLSATMSDCPMDLDEEDSDLHDRLDPQLSSLDASLATAIADARIPQCLVQMLKASCLPLPNESLPDVHSDLAQLQSTIGACLGNCATEHFGLWTQGLLPELLKALSLSNGNPSIANATAAALRFRESMRKQFQPNDLQLMLQLASSATPCQREAIEILGILCSNEEHPEVVNRQVCSALTGIDSKRACVVNEILASLMDIYGNDNVHPEVFKELSVLNYFVRTTPFFKKLINIERCEADDDEVEQWSETHQNAGGFIAYKKGQL